MRRKVEKQSLVVARTIANVPLSFVLDPSIGRAPLDNLGTDLDLITKVHAMELPAVLRINDSDVLDRVTQTVKRDFPGRRGTFKLINVPLANSRGESGRQLIVVGLGPCQKYDGRIVCETFETLFTQALELGSESVTVPFFPNPMTKDCLSHKATAFKLKDVIEKVLKKHSGTVKLREVKLWCTPSAVRHIRHALESDLGAGEGCFCEVSDE